MYLHYDRKTRVDSTVYTPTGWNCLQCRLPGIMMTHTTQAALPDADVCFNWDMEDWGSQHLGFGHSCSGQQGEPRLDSFFIHTL